jgi:hypothetical protein
MHVSRLGPNFSKDILPLSPVMQTEQPRCGISSFLDNLNIGMIYGSGGVAKLQADGYSICGDIQKR